MPSYLQIPESVLSQTKSLMEKVLQVLLCETHVFDRNILSRIFSSYSFLKVSLVKVTALNPQHKHAPALFDSI